MTEYEQRLINQNIILRWVIVLLLLIAVAGIIAGFILEEQHRALDNKQRAEHWTRIEDGIAGIKLKLDKNYEMILNDQNGLQQCANCHTHAPKVK